MTARDLTCREVIDLLTDYVEDALPAQERRRVEAHLRAATVARPISSRCGRRSG